MKAYFENDDQVLDSHNLAIPLLDLANSRGIHSDKILKGTRLFYQDMVNHNPLISHQQLDRIIKNALRCIPDNDLAFLLGRRFFPDNLGTVSKALLNAKSFADMSRIAKLFQQSLMPHVFFKTKYHHNKVHFIFNHSFGEPQSEVAVFWAEFLSAAIIGCFKWRLQRAPNATFRFPFKQPHYFEQYQSHISCPCLFEQPLLMFSFDLADFNQQQEGCSKTIKWHAINNLKRTNRTEKGLVQYLFEMLDKHGHLTLQDLAEHLSLSQATLKRKLSRHSINFSKLSDTVKQQQAVFQMVEQQKSNEEVATSLHYTDLSNFRRSFKRWTGMTPSELREQYLLS